MKKFLTILILIFITIQFTGCNNISNQSTNSPVHDSTNNQGENMFLTIKDKILLLV